MRTETSESYFPKWEPPQVPDSITPDESDVTTTHEERPTEIIPDPLGIVRDTVFGCLLGMLLGGLSGIFFGAAIGLTIADSAWLNKIIGIRDSSFNKSVVMSVPVPHQEMRRPEQESRDIEPAKTESLL